MLVKPKLLTFTLLHPLSKTAEWKMFVSTTINFTSTDKLIFNMVEDWIRVEVSRLGLGIPESRLTTIKTVNKAEKWCEHHESSSHHTVNCWHYQKWVKKKLREGSQQRQKENKEKGNIVEISSNTTSLESTQVDTVL